MKRLSLNERSGTTLSSSIVSNGGPCRRKPFVSLSKPVGASVVRGAGSWTAAGVDRRRLLRIGFAAHPESVAPAFERPCRVWRWS